MNGEPEVPEPQQDVPSTAERLENCALYMRRHLHAFGRLMSIAEASSDDIAAMAPVMSWPVHDGTGNAIEIQTDLSKLPPDALRQTAQHLATLHFNEILKMLDDIKKCADGIGNELSQMTKEEANDNSGSDQAGAGDGSESGV